MNRLKSSVIILGIESSCDDTSAAIIKDTTILSNVTASQEIHRQFGGVVPELASRAHQQNIVPVVDAALKKANVTLKDVDGIAFTKGPGLLGSLVVGTSFAKSICTFWISGGRSTSRENPCAVYGAPIFRAPPYQWSAAPPLSPPAHAVAAASSLCCGCSCGWPRNP